MQYRRSLAVVLFFFSFRMRKASHEGALPPAER